MNTIKQSAYFSLFLIAFGVMFRGYSIVQSGLDIGIANLIVNVALMGILGGAGFYLGQVKSREYIAIRHLAFSAAFVFFMSHTLSNLLGLYQISWVAYFACVFFLAVVIAIRGPKMFNKKNTANKPSQADS
ncbi:hypothetical protein [Shewanella baltica]|jgi:hypothetical protein|uniref:hypothetical protein n=1 Tax=Shewanella baltica TaxID=62322 RepID=UPI00217DD353|nr:hypothetical protein [Shewanella baltica]MCS6211445.1 hypothetical protein [Shewanella baltica]